MTRIPFLFNATRASTRPPRHLPALPKPPSSHPYRYASSSSSSSPTDPALAQALSLLDTGTRSLEEGDLDGALVKYKESLKLKETSGGWFNLGVGSKPVGAS